MMIHPAYMTDAAIIVCPSDIDNQQKAININGSCQYCQCYKLWEYDPLLVGTNTPPLCRNGMYAE